MLSSAEIDTEKSGCPGFGCRSRPDALVPFPHSLEILIKECAAHQMAGGRGKGEETPRPDEALSGRPPTRVGRLFNALPEEMRVQQEGGEKRGRMITGRVTGPATGR